VRGLVLVLLGMLALTATAAARSPLVPTPIGIGPFFHPSAANPSAAPGEPVGGLRCLRSEGSRMGVHLEVFARGRVVIVPTGVGVAPPLRSDGPYVLSGRCSYAVQTRAPTGVIEVAASSRLTLGAFFAVWGRSLNSRVLVGFRARPGEHVRAYVDGRSWRGDPRAIPLRRHAQVVLELGPFIPPHPTYRFAKGL
jgi:hypothetical protein